MEVPRLGVKLELEPPANATATAMPDPSRVGDLPSPSAYGSSQARGRMQLLAYTTATTAAATGDPSHVFDLNHSSWQCQILNPLIEATHRT